MAEYIEREAVLSAIWKTSAERDVFFPAIILDAIKSIPAADVRPVVLCKDCKNDCHCMIQDFMEDYGITPDDQNNFFCGYGEKEDKKDDR